MSSLIENYEIEEELQELLEDDEALPEAFFMALKNALVQLEHPAAPSHF
jgi:hypothetical protein